MHSIFHYQILKTFDSENLLSVESGALCCSVGLLQSCPSSPGLSSSKLLQLKKLRLRDAEPFACSPSLLISGRVRLTFKLAGARGSDWTRTEACCLLIDSEGSSWTWMLLSYWVWDTFRPWSNMLWPVALMPRPLSYHLHCRNTISHLLYLHTCVLSIHCEQHGYSDEKDTLLVWNSLSMAIAKEVERPAGGQ